MFIVHGKGHAASLQWWTCASLCTVQFVGFVSLAIFNYLWIQYASCMADQFHNKNASLLVLPTSLPCLFMHCLLYGGLSNTYTMHYNILANKVNTEESY